MDAQGNLYGTTGVRRRNGTETNAGRAPDPVRSTVLCMMGA